MLLSIYIYFQTLSVRGANWRDEELPSPAVPWVNTGGSLEADTWVWGDLYRSEHSTGVTRPSTCRHLLIPRHKSRESWGSLGSRAESLLYRSFSCLRIFSSVVWCWNCPDHQPPSLNAEFCVFSIFPSQKKDPEAVGKFCISFFQLHRPKSSFFKWNRIQESVWDIQAHQLGAVHTGENYAPPGPSASFFRHRRHLYCHTC